MSSVKSNQVAVFVLLAAVVSGCSSAESRPAVVLTSGNVEAAVEAEAVPVAQFAASELTNFLSRTLDAPVPLVRTINPANDSRDVVVSRYLKHGVNT